MKKFTLITSLLAMLFLTSLSSNAQAVFPDADTTYISYVQYFNTDKGVMKATLSFIYPNHEITLLDSSGNFYKRISVSVTGTWLFCSDKLFNSDSKIEIIVGSPNNYPYIIDEDGNLITSMFNQTMSNPIGNPEFQPSLMDVGPGGTKMFTYNTKVDKNLGTLVTRIFKYNLPGHVKPMPNLIVHDTVKTIIHDTTYIATYISHETFINTIDSISITTHDSVNTTMAPLYSISNHTLTLHGTWPQASVYDLKGQLIKVELNTGNVIDLSSYAAGIYIIYAQGYRPIKVVVTRK